MEHDPLAAESALSHQAESIVGEFAFWIALALEFAACCVIAYAAIVAVSSLLLTKSDPARPYLKRRSIFVSFGLWLIVALEFALASDILRTAIAPSWESVGVLAAVAVIRTLLSFFLSRDIELVLAQQRAEDLPPRNPS
jgi:uncharacterized membrane protein